jgi:hypothetical protein
MMTFVVLMENLRDGEKKIELEVRSRWATLNGITRLRKWISGRGKRIFQREEIS